MKIFNSKLISNHWPKFLSGFFFILLFVAYANTFAVFTPGETLNPNCAPGVVGCIVVPLDASTSATGYLTSTDWNTFNGKQATGLTALLGSSNTFTQINPLITPVESWIGPSSITGIYFKGGFIGIGTVNPNNLIQVAGLIDFNSTDLNTKIGKDAGLNIVAGATNNTFIGYEAGNSGSGSSTNAADNNTAVGYQAFYSNTTGSYNSAQGVNSLYNSGSTRTAGSFITGVSYKVISIGSTDFTLIGGSNSVGTSFTATGPGSGTGTASSNSSNNIAVGVDAGRYITGSTELYAPSNSTFLGQNTKALADGGTNETVIGYLAIGNGSNSVTLGNTSVTKTILRSNVGIGTESLARDCGAWGGCYKYGNYKESTDRRVVCEEI